MSLRPSTRKRTLACTLLLAFTFFPSPVPAATDTWIGPDTSVWWIPSNWSLHRFPNRASDDAFLFATDSDQFISLAIKPLQNGPLFLNALHSITLASQGPANVTLQVSENYSHVFNVGVSLANLTVGTSSTSSAGIASLIVQQGVSLTVAQSISPLDIGSNGSRGIVSISGNPEDLYQSNSLVASNSQTLLQNFGRGLSIGYALAPPGGTAPTSPALSGGSLILTNGARVFAYTTTDFYPDYNSFPPYSNPNSPPVTSYTPVYVGALGAKGLLSLDNNCIFSADDLYIGHAADPTSAQPADGTLSISNNSTVGAWNVHVGTAGGNGSLTMTNRSFLICGGLDIGASASPSSAAATAIINNSNLLASSVTIGHGSAASLQITGASRFDCTNIALGTPPAPSLAPPPASISINAGATLTAVSFTAQPGSLLHLNGGILHIATSVFYDGGSGMISLPNGTLDWTAGTLILGDPTPSYYALSPILLPSTLTIPPDGFLQTYRPLALSSLVVRGRAQLLQLWFPSNFNRGLVTHMLTLHHLTIATDTPNHFSGTLDLANAPLVDITDSPSEKSAALTHLAAALASGYNPQGPHWTGPGITSSTVAKNPGSTLALFDNADLSPPSGTDNYLIVSLALLGDTNLDGRVDTADLNTLASHWLQHTPPTASAGDLSGPGGIPDGTVDHFDLDLLLSNWQATLPSSSLALLTLPDILTQAALLPLSAPLPEPATLLFLSPTLFLLKNRRRARSH